MMRFCLLVLCTAWSVNLAANLPATDSTTTIGAYTDETTEEFTITSTTDLLTTTEVISTSLSPLRSPKSETPTPQLLSMRLQTDIPKHQCGRRLVIKGPRIVGGNNSYLGEYPWAVSVRLVTTHYCGGTIISKFWVLTAAHCVKRYGARYFRVRPGGRDVHLDKSLPDADIYVEEISVHPDFGKPRRYSNDLALLKLKTAILYSDVAQPICLPKTPDEDYEGRNATVVGWGWLNEVDKGKSKLLQKVQVPVMNNSICAEWYSEAYNGYVQIHDYQICAGYKEGGRDSCQGDSGGPLVMQDKDRFTLIGVVSAGVGCARKHLPGIYSRVSIFIDWINEVTGGLHEP